MRKRRIKYLVMAIAFIFLLGCVITSPIHADVGNSFSGGSSSGGGSSYSGGGGSFNGIFFLLGSPGGIVGLVVIVVIMYFVNRNRSVGSDNRPLGAGIKPNANINEEEVVARIKTEDPAFSPDNFKTFTSEVWLTLQEAWEAKAWQKVRPFESNTLFNVHNRQLQEYIDHKKTNFMEMQNVRDITIARYRSDEEYEIVSVKLDASLLDYVIDDESGKVIEGSKTNYVHRSYNLEFIRKKGVKTVEKEGTNVTNCPNCGAPTEVTSSGQCEYCKSIITKGDYGWVLNKYAPWS